MSNVNCITKNNTDYMYEDTAGRSLIGSAQDTSTTAIKAYAVGDLFWLNNLLYRVTAAIASGGTITVGTNSVATTVSAELAARVKSDDIQNTYGSTDTRPISGTGVADALSGFSTTLDGLDDVNINTSTLAPGQVLKRGNDGWVNGEDTGNEMIPVTNDIATIKALANGNDNYVINAYTAKRWSNVDGLTLYTTAAKDTDTIGDWDDDWTGSGASRSGWLWHKALFKILSNDFVKGEPVFDVKDGEVVSIYAYRIDDEIYVAVDNPSGNPQEQGWYESDGQTPPTYTLTTDTTVQVGKTYYVGGGAIAIKLNGAIQNNDGVDIGIELSTKRFASVQFETL